MAIVVSGAGLIAFGLSGLQRQEPLNIYLLIYGGSIIFFAFLYLTSTATRLRYQNPGEAQTWYISESGRRQTYDHMVEMFWTGLWFGIEVSMPFYLSVSIRKRLLGVIAAVIWLIFVNLYIAMIKSVSMDYDRKTGNLVYDHNRKMRSAKEKRELFDAPPIKRSQ